MMLAVRRCLLSPLFWMGNLLCLSGMAAAPALRPLAQTARMPAPAGVVVESVLPGSPAQKAGLLAGDVLLRYAGRPVNTPIAFEAAAVNLVTQPEVTVKRGERTFLLMLPFGAGKWVVAVPFHAPPSLILRPHVSSSILSLYQSGRKSREVRQYEAANTLWQAAFREAETSGDDLAADWLCGLIADNYRILAMDGKKTPTKEGKNAHLKEGLEWAQRLWQRISPGEDRESQCAVSVGIAYFHLNLEHPLEARPWLERAYSLAVECHDEMWAANTLNFQGMVAISLAMPQYGGPGAIFTQKAQFAKAQKIYTEALDIYKRLAPESKEIADVYSSLTEIAQVNGDLKTACQDCSRACDLYRKFAPDSLVLAGSLSSRANLETLSSELAKAQRDYEEAITLCRVKFSAPPETLATLYSHLARVLTMQGDTGAAQVYAHKTLDLWGRVVTPSFSERADLAITQGLLAAMQGDLASAAKIYGDSLTAIKRAAPISTEIIVVLTSLGLVELAQGDLEKSEKHFKAVLALLQYIPSAAIARAGVLNSLGMASASREDYQHASDYFEQARKIWKQKMPKSAGMVTSLLGLASVGLSQGDLQSAHTFCAEALATPINAASASIEVEGQTLQGQILLQQQKPQSALPCFKKATTMLETQRQAIFSLDARAFLLQQNAEAYTGLMQTYLALHQPDKAFAAVEQTRARSLADSMAKRRYELVRQLPAKLRDQQIALDDERRVRENALEHARNTDAAAQEKATRKALGVLSVRQRRLDADVALTLPRAAALEYPQPIDLKAAQQSLPPGTLALVYAADDKQTNLFTLTRSAFHFYHLPLSRQQLRQRIEGAHTLLANVNSTPQQVAPALTDLYTRLLAPAQKEIAQARSLVICPDGALHGLPFAALMPKAGRFLIEDKPVQVIGSLTLYRVLRSPRFHRRVNGARVLALGDPAYGTPRLVASAGDLHSETSETMGRDRQALRETGAVARKIGALYAPHSLVLTQQQATVANLLTRSERAGILHLGCHGLADSHDPLSSWLALTPDAHHPDGLLYAWQIMRMKLNARLVVLWACETGLGAESRFEGMQGVSRAFQTAGADNVLMTLWVVQEKPTADILLDFYTLWKKGQGKKTLADALREAQIKALKRDPRPYLWAPLVLNGAGE